MKYGKIIETLRKKGYKEAWPPSRHWSYYENEKFTVDVSYYWGVRVFNKKTQTVIRFNPMLGKIEKQDFRPMGK